MRRIYFGNAYGISVLNAAMKNFLCKYSNASRIIKDVPFHNKCILHTLRYYKNNFIHSGKLCTLNSVVMILKVSEHLGLGCLFFVASKLTIYLRIHETHNKKVDFSLIEALHDSKQSSLKINDIKV